MSPVKVLIGTILVIGFFIYLLSFRQTAPIVPYQHQHFYQKYSPHSTTYRIMVISDMDKLSRSGDRWKSIALYGTLERDQSSGRYSIKWSPEREITSKFSEAGRSMELSDLCNYNGNLYSFDDRTGMVIVIEDENAYPVGILMDGNGKTNKGFKGEWCTVKDGQLFIGGMGKEWTDEEGNFVSNDPLWIKIFSETGCVRHINWMEQYQSLRLASGTTSPGYLLHEAVSWVPSLDSWLFLPRRVSTEKYNAVQDEFRCGNIAISASSDFSRVNVISEIGPFSATKGFSSVKYVPFRENELVVLKTSEVGETTSYIMVYDLSSGKVLMEETPLPGNVKFEGLEFL